MKFTYQAQGETRTRTAMAFGKAYEAVNEHLTEGDIRLYGKFDGGTFVVIGLGLPPRGEQTVA
jgi:hypothetical protein